ncbi:MAG: hypothetical protein ACR2LS_09415 [Thermomicrobiales bacterium]
MDRNDTAPPVATTDMDPRDGHDRVDDPVTFSSRPATGYATGSDAEIGQNTLSVRNRVQWGPIFAGVVTAAVTMIVLSILGLALGASVLGRNVEGGDAGGWAAIWGIISAIVAFFLGGWVAARSAAVSGAGSGMLNGLMAGCATLLLLLWLTGLGLGNVFGAVGANFDDLSNAVQDQAQEAGIDSTDEAVAEADQSLNASFSDVEEGAWWTLIGLLVALSAAVLGGMVGHNSRNDLVEGSAA